MCPSFRNLEIVERGPGLTPGPEDGLRSLSDAAFLNIEKIKNREKYKE